MFISDKAFSVVWPKKDGKKNLNTAPEYRAPRLQLVEILMMVMINNLPITHL